MELTVGMSLPSLALEDDNPQDKGCDEDDDLT